MRDISCLSAERLAPILDRHKNLKKGRTIPNIPLTTLLINILEKANDFVPSESGSILLDDPQQKYENIEERELTFVCCFGPAAVNLIGDRISMENGIAGQVYKTGTSIITNNTGQAQHFSKEYDRKLNYSTDSVLCVAIRIGNSICGVIELLNKVDGQGYQDSEKGLLEIFAHYISSTIQNALDAKKIEKMVRMDDLTGLSNDRYLHEMIPIEVERHLRSGDPLSVIFLDLDHFKSINDTYGHLAGSSALAEFGHLLADVIDVKGATLARYGGDEFVVLLPGCDEVMTSVVAETLRRTAEDHVFLSGTWGKAEDPLHLGGVITTSIGITSFQAASGGISESAIEAGVRLLQTADKAMYDSKQKGKNCVTVRSYDGSD